ncbi:alanyl-tRNA synthetase domain-containing protein [Panus rudis PR-1116 ss-1]|nr:alanyl-tRNA synthetase domain-containing protein [Panus rudis PR-1116 ss-1]
MAAAVVVPPPTTPPSYHRIVSPNLRVPTDPRSAIPVGILACQRDPLLRELVSTVVSSTLAQAPPTSNSNRKSKKDKGPVEQLLEVVLHDTVLFPEGGGQPNDIGLLTSSDGELWEVVDVKRRGGHAIHFVRVKDGDVDGALKAFTPGSIVNVSLGEQGFQRRLDHMSIHTSQHLLSAVLELKLNLPTLSWALTSFPTPCYVEVPRTMTPEEITLIQDEVNRLVFEGRSVHIEVEELDPTEKVYSGPSVGIPSDYTGGVKRTVVIDGIDRNPCCGTHLPSLHNLQVFLIPHMEGLARGGASSSARLYFLSGPRLITYLASTHSLLTATSNTLSCGAPQVPERVEQVIDDRSKATKRVDDIEAELAAYVAKDVVNSAAKRESGLLVTHRHRTDDSSNALAFLSAVSSVIQSEVKDSGYLVVLSSSPSMQSVTGTTVVMVSGSSEQHVKLVGDALRGKLSVRGGGKGVKWSGKFTGVWQEHREGKIVDEILAEIV